MEAWREGGWKNDSIMKNVHRRPGKGNLQISPELFKRMMTELLPSAARIKTILAIQVKTESNPVFKNYSPTITENSDFALSMEKTTRRKENRRLQHKIATTLFHQSAFCWKFSACFVQFNFFPFFRMPCISVPAWSSSSSRNKRFRSATSAPASRPLRQPCTETTRRLPQVTVGALCFKPSKGMPFSNKTGASLTILFLYVFHIGMGCSRKTGRWQIRREGVSHGLHAEPQHS